MLFRKLIGKRGIERNYLTLSSFWFIYFNVVGISLLYLPLYLRNVTCLTPIQIGFVLSTYPIANLLYQPLWGIFADYTGYRAQLLILACFGSAISYLLLYRSHNFSTIFIYMSMLTLFSTSIVPLANSVTFAIIAQSPATHIGKLRIYGTFGLLFSILFYPMFFKLINNYFSNFNIKEKGQREYLFQEMFLVMSFLCFMSGVILTKLDFSLKSLNERAQFIEILSLMKNKLLLYRLLVILGGYIFLHGPLALFSFFLSSRGLSTHWITNMWIFMLIVEFLLVKASTRIQKKFSQQSLVTIAIFLGSIRWLISGYADNLFLIFLIQAIHGIVVIGLILGSSIYIEELLPPQLRSSGQAIVGIAGNGIGALISSIAIGFSMEKLGTNHTYIFFGMGGIIFSVIIYCLTLRQNAKNKSFME